MLLGGVRSASVQVIATATLGAVFALGGLGRYIIDGAAQQDDGMMFGGVMLVAALAMTSEALLAGLQRVALAAAQGGGLRPGPTSALPSKAALEPTA